MPRHALCLSSLACLLAAPVQAQAPLAAEHLIPSLRQASRLDARHGFQLRNAHTDAFGITHTRFIHTFKGLPVLGSEAITHVGDGGRELPHTLALMPPTDLVTEPALSQSEALALAHQDLAPRGGYAHAPSVELVIYPVLERRFQPRSADEARLGPDRAPAGAFGQEAVRHALAYHVHAELENGATETEHMDYLIDAQSGTVLKKWSTLQTDVKPRPAALNSNIIIPINPWLFGNGSSEYSWMVWIDTTLHSRWIGNYNGIPLVIFWHAMEDPNRGVNGATYPHNTTVNLDHATSGNGTVLTDSDNNWGDGQNYTTGSTTSVTGQTASVDAHYGLQTTWDMYGKVFGRNGIDGHGTATFSRVHYDTNYNNAFWNDTCFCMTYGDGDMIKKKASTALDVAGHELTHGVCANSAALVYSGESGGLNEANSDIFGAMATFYARGTGGLASTIPNSGGSWLHGEQYMLNANHFLRCLYKPSKDGVSPDAWYAGIAGIDVHYSSGPMNRCFYFLAQGASTNAADDTYSSYLPGGMAGIGNDKAARIWYRTLTVYLASHSQYIDARKWALQSAIDLYGADSTEYKAVDNAFHAINVF